MSRKPITVSEPITLRGGIKKRIHMVGSNIRHNKKTGANLPCITVKCRDGTFHCHHFEVHGALSGVQNFASPLSSGAVVWLETAAPITLQAEPL
jgi:hypothetical protein